MKRQLKRSAETVVSVLAPLVWRFQQAPRMLVLMYHRVLPANHPDRGTEQPGMYVSPETLAMHLELLRRQGFEFVHLDDWLRAAENKQSLPARACAITFDDGWRDNYDHAYPVLKQARAPATIYLVSDLVGTQYSFWPNGLARILAAGDAATLSRLPEWLRRMVQAQTRTVSLDAEQIDAVISACKVRSDAEMLDIVRAVEQPAAPSGRDLMSWAEIQEMKAGGLVRFGSHTRRHTRLSGISSSQDLRDEVLGSRETIERQLGSAPSTFCYPNGDTSEQAVNVVRGAYQGAVTTRKGWHSPQADPFLIRRIGVHEDVSSRPTSFLARISGWI